MKVAHLCQTSWNPRGNNNYSKSSHEKGNEKHDIPQITIQHLLKVFLTPINCILSISQNKISLFLPWESDKKGNERVNWMVTFISNYGKFFRTIANNISFRASYILGQFHCVHLCHPPVLQWWIPRTHQIQLICKHK